MSNALNLKTSVAFALTLIAAVAAPEANAQQYRTAAPTPTYYYTSKYAPTVAAPAPAPYGYTYATQQPQQQYAAPAPAAVAAAAPAAAASGDPYGFTAWLNGVRASHGLSAVGYDPSLSAWANANNAQQQSRGMGHHVMGPARRQNSAMGGYASIGGMWMSSPAHQAALLDPTIRMIGIAGLGAYWTFNAY